MDQASTTTIPLPSLTNGYQRSTAQTGAGPESAELDRLRRLDIETRLRFAEARRQMDTWLRPERASSLLPGNSE